MPTPLQRVATSLGVRRPEGGGPVQPPRDERTLLQVLLGNLLFAAIAAGASKLLGSDLVAAVAFGVIVYVFFLYLDLRARRRQREGDGSPPSS